MIFKRIWESLTKTGRIEIESAERKVPLPPKPGAVLRISHTGTGYGLIIEQGIKNKFVEDYT